MRFSVAVIPLKIINNEIKILLQRRLNKREKEWVGTWEFPQGKIEDFKIFKSAEKELLNETGMNLDSLYIGLRKYKGNTWFNGKAFSVEPFIVVKVGEHLNFHFLSLVSREPYETKEACSQTWFSLKEIGKLLLSDRICPINIAALEKLKGMGSSQILDLVKSDTVLKISKNRPIIAVDIGGIIIKWDDKALISNLKKIYRCDDRNLQNFLIEGGMRHCLHNGSMSHLELWKLLNKNLITVSYDEYLDEWKKSITIIPENYEIIKKLKNLYSDVSFVIASNIDPITEDFVTSHLNFDEIFDFCFMSWRMGVTKPDELFYKYIEDVCQSKKIMLIDDRKLNLNVAQNIGFSIYEQKSNENLNLRKLKLQIEEWIVGTSE